MEKAREFQEKIYFCLTDYAKAFVWITTNCGKFLKRWEYQTTLPALRNMYADQQSTEGSALRLYILLPCLFNLYAEYMWNAELSESQAGIKITERNINNFRHADDTTLIAEIEEVLKSLLIRLKEESEKACLEASGSIW